MGKSTISMAIFNSYVSSPEGKSSLNRQSATFHHFPPNFGKKPAAALDEEP